MKMILNLNKNIVNYDKLVKNGNFVKKYEIGDFFELFNKKILILGFGRIGRALAKRCLGFEMKVYVYDPFVSEEEINKIIVFLLIKVQVLKLLTTLAFIYP